MEITYQVEPLADAFTMQADVLMYRYYYTTPAHADIPEYDFNWDLYRKLESTGMIRCFTARSGHLLVGFALYCLTEHPHHRGLRMADGDGIAVDKDYRGQGIGGKLYDFAEPYLRGIGVQKVLHRYRVCYGVDEPLFPKKGFHLIEHVYLKDL